MTDAPTASAATAPGAMFDLHAAPLHVARVRLRVRDLARVADFYEGLLGLSRIDQGAGFAVLGAPGPDGAPRALLELSGDARLAPLDRRQAGLFHTAFLMPSRADLGRWLNRTAQAGIRLEGASDHVVSEAVYLSDPEGNGIEVYADRPVASWREPSGEIRLATLPLDAQDLLASGGGGAYAQAPSGLMVGHVHLQVGETGRADGFYRDVLGFDVVADYPGASFYGSGGYHHQLAGNVWNSRGAKRRPQGMVGLDQVVLAAREPAVRDAALARAEAAGLVPETRDGLTLLHDPWGGAVALAA
ncbi:VOC family protein [Albimonas sp. CAU 1670]|uniref:VOC family protein n=1 Tax=Albimonas sp. CAU 1670 TaxID=3032599 RepID=UPI0023DBE2A3|nr:VOC family protein [Albimonas sp. CAU 1670]MDF2235028.1 VOC family protein [Albimonas sp. CAU 1670]